MCHQLWYGYLRLHPVQVTLNNAKAMVYVNHQERTQSHVTQVGANVILSMAELHVPVLSTVHLPSMESWQADFLSCQQLNQGASPGRCAKFCQGLKTPYMDLQASRFITKLDRRGTQKFVVDTPATPWDQFFPDLHVPSTYAPASPSEQDTDRCVGVSQHSD